MKIVKKRVMIIFLTLLFTILAFGKVDLYAETTDEGTQLEETTLNEPASETQETKEKPEDTPQDVEEVEKDEETEEEKETENEVNTKETVEEERPQVEDKTEEKSDEKAEEKSVEESEDQQTVSDAKEEPVDQESKEEEIKDDEKAEEKAQGEVETEEKAEVEGEEKSEVEGETETETEGEEKPEEKADDSEEAKEAEKTDEEGEELEEGTIIDPENLNPLGAGPEGNGKPIEVRSFEDLKAAIENAGTDPTVIKIMNSFEISETITIGANQNINLISGADRNMENNKVTPIGEDKIVMPKDNDSMEERQKLVKDAEKAGEKALDITDLSNNSLPKVDYVLKRKNTFTKTLIKIEGGGILTLGADKKDPLFIDGNNTVETKIEGGSFIEVSGTLVINGGTIANGKNNNYSSAPIYVDKGGEFTMNGGRITSNENISYDESKFDAAGGVYVAEGGKFTLTAGSIDNNYAPVGGVFLGRINGNQSKDRKFAKFTMEGGYIVRNIGPTFLNKEPRTQNYGGGVHVDSLGNFIFENGIIAGNESYRGGGVAINDNYVLDTNGVNYSKIQNVNYDDYLKYAGAYYTQNGGLIYKNIAKVHIDGNKSGAGGGIYINASTAKLNGGYLLNNKSENMGGGIYVSIVPHVLKLDHVLISQNKAVKGNRYHLSAGDGGGFWHCPAGNVDFEDFNSIYIFDNDASSGGKDIFTHGKRDDYKIYNEYSYDFPEFLTNISPITEKGNIIKYLYDGKEVPEWMYHTDKAVSLQAIYDAKTKNEAWTNSKLFIMGNTALKGGGIGSNASTTPPGKSGSYEITIDKKWHKSIPEDKRPGSIWVDLFIGDAKYGEVELSKANNWTAKFENLPFTAEELMKKKIKYSIKERNDDFYSVVDEALKALEVERVFAGEKYPDDAMASGWDTPWHKNMDYKIVFIHKDKNGNEVSREDIKIDYKQDKEKWTGLVKDMIIGKYKDLKNVKITYYGYDKAYEPDSSWAGLGFNGLTDYSNWFDEEGPWHEAYILEKEDGTVEIQLPYLWTQYMGNPDGTTDDYSQNTNGYRLNFVPNHRFTITNYPYSEIPVVKKWDKSINEKDIPDSVKVYLLRDGKRVKDEDGNDRYIILSKENGWKGIFDRLPYFELAGMGFEKYWVKEDSEIFIPLVTRKENSILNIRVERDKDSDKYLIYKDYTGGYSRIKYIPFEVHYIYKDGNKEVKEIYTKKLEQYTDDHSNNHLDTVIKDIVMNGKFKDSDIEIKMYYDENGNPFPRNLGQYQASWDEDDIVTNEGAYILKLVEENGKLVLYVPKLTDVGDEDNLLYVNANVEDGRKFLEMTNYYQPKHRIEIEKVWDTENKDLIPKTLRVKINGKYVDKEITLSPEEWKYMEEFLGKGILSANSYSFSEEDLEKFDGKQSIEKSMEFEVEDKSKALSFKDENGEEITKEAFLKMIQGKNYTFELKEASDDKAEVEIKYDADGKLVIVYPVDVTITEVAHVLFTNTEKPEEPPEEPKESKTYVRVSKVWEALGETESIRVQLYVNGEATNKFLTLSEANGWTATFYDLDEYDHLGNRYVYTVREVGDENGLYKIGDREFEVSYAGNMDKGFTITNKEIPPEEPPEEPEEPDEPEPEEPDEPEDEGGGENIIPKTGVKTDAKSIYLSLILLIALVVLKRKKYSK